MKSPPASTAVIYHHSCPDGFAAAWSVHKTGLTAQYFPVPPRQQVPRLGPDIQRVYILDTSFPRDEMIALTDRFGASKVTLLDHHDTAARDLAGLPGCHVDQSKSGAMLTWEHFHPGQPAPPLIEYVQDRDLWQWELPDSRAVSAYLHAQDYHFECWTRAHNALRRNKEARTRIISAGYDILRLADRAVHSAAKHAVFGDIAGFRVPIVNSVQHRSEVAHLLLTRHPDAPFAAVYRDEDGQRRWSLRSTPDRCDVAAIAERYGGGGHPVAAAFTQPLRPPVGVQL